MGKRTLILAIVLIIAGVALIVYQDPQFRLAINTSSTSSPSPSSTSRFVTGGGSSSQSITTSYNALDIIESLAGAGLVGIGLVFVGVEMFSASLKQM
jgi:hypothetical protein